MNWIFVTNLVFRKEGCSSPTSSTLGLGWMKMGRMLLGHLNQEQYWKNKNLHSCFQEIVVIVHDIRVHDIAQL